MLQCTLPYAKKANSDKLIGVKAHQEKFPCVQTNTQVACVAMQKELLLYNLLL